MKPDKKVILITGCSSGFGKLLAYDLSKKGHTVYASMRNLNTRNIEVYKELEKQSEKERYDLRVIELDVTDNTSVQDAVKHILTNEGKIDVLVNNAGVMNTGVSEAFSIESIKEQFNVNVIGPARTIKAVLPHMRKQKSGLLIQLSSLAGRYVFPFFGIYCASKFAVEALAESYRYELDRFKIDSVIVEPGNYATNLTHNAPLPDDTDILNTYDELAQMGSQQLSMLEQLNSQDDWPMPQEVVDAISQLINMKTGERPLRTVVNGGFDIKTDEYNNIASTYQYNMMKSMGYA